MISYYVSLQFCRIRIFFFSWPDQLEFVGVFLNFSKKNIGLWCCCLPCNLNLGNGLKNQTNIPNWKSHIFIFYFCDPFGTSTKHVVFIGLLGLQFRKFRRTSVQRYFFKFKTNIYFCFFSLVLMLREDCRCWGGWMCCMKVPTDAGSNASAVHILSMQLFCLHIQRVNTNFIDV